MENVAEAVEGSYTARLRFEHVTRSLVGGSGVDGCTRRRRRTVTVKLNMYALTSMIFIIL